MNGTSEAVSETKHLLNTTKAQCELLLRKYAATRSLTKIKQLHARTITSGSLSSSCSSHLRSNLATTYTICGSRTLVAGFDLDTFVQNSLLAMYMNCGEKEAARRVFDTMWEKSVVSWNTMINGYFRNGCAKEALMVFNQMMDVSMEPDCATVVSVLPACGYLKDLVLGRRVHELVEEKGLGKKIAVRNALVDTYAKCGSMDEARVVVNKMGERDVVTWTTMINGYVLNGDARSALTLCQPMQFDGVSPSSVSIASLLSACTNM